MFESLLITLRETLEAALVVFIVLSYLKKIKQTKLYGTVYAGVGSALIVSAISAIVLSTLAGGFEGRTEEIFEGVVMMLAAVLLTTMIIWMAKAHHVQHQLEARIQVEVSDKHRFGIFAVTFLAVLREGIETVIFLGAAVLRGAQDVLTGSVVGIVLALIAGYALFYGSQRMHIKTFFRVTSALLIFFAAGLVAHGLHEFQEAGLITLGLAEAWNMNHVIDDHGTFGSILAGVFGYNGNPSVLEAWAYFLYLLGAFWMYRSIGMKKPAK